MSNASHQFIPGPMFQRAYATNPVAQCAWRFLNDERQVRPMVTGTRRGLAALDLVQADLARAFEELHAGDETAKHLKRMIGRMARQIMKREGFVFERSGIPVSDRILFSSAARYRSRS
ncbi:hypothetical protein QTI33_08125 [Variovorax sp. J22P271]|uniref:hypothetical protein n=1 Tax=Variovorax davisae TaxID=3053515 RepID=UPI002578DB09|nr:hypothetical protein [Variovorax sp. J22P271]MDM0032104.1 hypothetical protein [Variovorax sp. J22P271]